MHVQGQSCPGSRGGGALDSKGDCPQGSTCSHLIRDAFVFCMWGSERTQAGQPTKEELLVHHGPRIHTEIGVPGKTQAQISQWQKAAGGRV